MKKTFSIISVAIILLFFLIFSYIKNSVIENKTVIKFSSWGSQSEVSVLKEVIEDYEKQNPSIKIDFVHIPQNYFQKLQLLFASGLEPDVVFLNNQNFKLYSRAGLIENLTGKIDTSSFFNQSVDAFFDNGSLYAVPRDISGLVVYYNKDIFSSAGLSAEKIKSFDDFLFACEKLKRQGYFSFNAEDNPVYWLSFVSGFKGGIFSDDGQNVLIDSDSTLDALNLYSGLIHKYGYAPSKAQTGSMTPAQMFISGKLAMYFSGRWVVPKFRETINFNWDVFEFPSPEGIYVDASGWAVSRNSKNKDSALNFINYLASKEVSEKFTAIGLILPARTDVAYSRVFSDKLPYNSGAFLNMLVHSRPTPVTVNYAKITDIVNEKVKTLIETGVDTHDIIDFKTVNKIKEFSK